MTGTNDKLRSLFLTVIMVVSIFGATVAFSGTAAAANAPPVVDDTSENEGEISIVFSDQVDLVYGDQGNEITPPPTQTNDEEYNGLVVYYREAGTSDYEQYNVTDGDDITTRDAEGGGYEVTIDSSAITSDDISPASDVKVDVGTVQPQTADDVEEYQNEIGNTSIELSAAQMSEDNADHNSPSDAQRIYQGTPVRFLADSDNTDVLFENADSGEIELDGSTGANSRSIIFDSDNLESGTTYRLTYNEGVEGDELTQYVNVTSLDLSANLEEDGKVFEDNEEFDLNVDGSAIRGNSDLAIEVRYDNDSAPVTEYEQGSLDNRGNYEETISDLDLNGGHNYSVHVIDAETGVEEQAGTFEVDAAPDIDSASFESTVVSDTRGDIVQIDVDTEGADDEAPVTVSLGSIADDTNYVTNVTVADTGGDGFTLEFNSYAAGTNQKDRVFSVEGGNVTNWDNESGAFIEDLRENYKANYTAAHDEVDEVDELGDDYNTSASWKGFARLATLDAGSYPLKVIAGDVDTLDDTEPDDVGTMSLSSRTTESSTVWVAPAGDSDSIDLDYIENNAGDSLTQSEMAADGEVIVHEIKATGLEGAIVNRTAADDDVSVEDAFLAEEGSADSLNLWSASFQEVEPRQNAERHSINLNNDNAEVFADFENDTYYVALKLGEVDQSLLQDGKLWNASFDINEYESVGPVLGGRTGAGTVDSDWTYEDAEAEVATNDDDEIILRNQDNQVIRSDGSTTLAPGTDLELYIDASDASGDPFIQTLETNVTQDRTFRFSADLNDKVSGINFTAELSRANAQLTAGSVSYDGQIRGIPEADVTFNSQDVGESDQVVRVASTYLSDGGFIAIHEGNASGDIVGVSNHLQSGDHQNVSILLDSDVDDGTTLVATPHLDTDADNSFEYDASDEDTPDGPYTTDGAQVTDSGDVTISSAAANFQVSDLTPSSTTVTAGDSLSTIEATVENTGGQEATQTVELVIGDSTFNSQDVTLGADESQTVTFSEVDTSSLSEGTYTHGIASADDEATGALTVEAASTPTPDDPTATPDDPTATPTPDDPTATSTPDDSTDEPTDTPTSSDGGPGFGIALAIVALLGAALIAVRRD